MTSGTKKVAWAVGLLAGAAGIGGLTYFLMKPKQIAQQQGTTPPLPPPGGGGTKPTFITPTASPGIYAAVMPNRNVSWVDRDGKPINGGGGGIDTSTATVPR